MASGVLMLGGKQAAIQPRADGAEEAAEAPRTVHDAVKALGLHKINNKLADDDDDAVTNVKAHLLSIYDNRVWIEKRLGGNARYTVEAGDRVEIEDRSKQLQEDIVACTTWMEKNRGVDETVKDGFEALAKEVLRKVHYVSLAHILIENAWGSKDERAHVMLEFMTNEHHKNNKKKPFLQLLMYIKHYLKADGARKHNDTIFTRVVTAAGLPTVAWKRVGTIEEYIQTVVSGNPCMWGIAATGDNAVMAVKYFTNWKDMCLMPIVKDKGMRSYENGVYLARAAGGEPANTFLRYPLDPAHPLCKHTAEVPAKHFEGLEFPEDLYRATKEDIRNWRDIETPAFDSIFETQGIVDPEVMRFIYALLGRIFFKNGEMEDWQVIIWIVGLPGTGKSQFCILVRHFYEEDDVGIISNNIEKQFGLSQAVCGKLLYVASEVRADFKLDLSEMLSLTVPNEKMSMAVKYKNALVMTVDAVGIFSGQTFLTDNVPASSAEALARRVAGIRFGVKPKKEDPTLSRKLCAESPKTLLKSVCALLELTADEDRRASLWTFIPPYFRDVQETMLRNMDPVRAFICSEEIERGGGYTVTFEDFQKRFNEYCKKNNHRAYRLVPDNYNPALKTYDACFVAAQPRCGDKNNKNNKNKRQRTTEPQQQSAGTGHKRFDKNTIVGLRLREDAFFQMSQDASEPAMSQDPASAEHGYNSYDNGRGSGFISNARNQRHSHR